MRCSSSTGLAPLSPLDPERVMPEALIGLVTYPRGAYTILQVQPVGRPYSD
jgi:hypothetical protein